MLVTTKIAAKRVFDTRGDRGSLEHMVQLVEDEVKIMLRIPGAKLDRRGGFLSRNEDSKRNYICGLRSQWRRANPELAKGIPSCSHNAGQIDRDMTGPDLRAVIAMRNLLKTLNMTISQGKEYFTVENARAMDKLTELQVA